MSAVKVPGWFWLVAVLALIWNGLGVMAYVMQATMSAEALAALPEAQREIYASLPGWVNIAFAVAVFAGLLGAIALLIRRTWAKALFALSLLAVLVQHGYLLTQTNTAQVMGSQAMIMPAIVVLIAMLLIWFAARADKHGWLE